MRLAAGMHGRCATSHLWMVPPGQKRRNSSAVFRRCMWHLRDSARSGSQRGASQSPALRPCDPQAQRVLRIGAPSFRRAGKSRAAVPRALLRTATSATKLSSSVTGSTDPSVERTHQAKVRRTLANLAPWCTGRTWRITRVGRAALIGAAEKQGGIEGGQARKKPLARAAFPGCPGEQPAAHPRRSIPTCGPRQDAGQRRERLWR